VAWCVGQAGSADGWWEGTAIAPVTGQNYTLRRTYPAGVEPPEDAPSDIVLTWRGYEPQTHRTAFYGMNLARWI
jgi:hypothetical protein